MKVPARQYLSLLATYLRPQWGQVLLLALVLLVRLGLELLSPQILAVFIDTAQAGQPLSGLLRLAGYFLLAALALQAANVAEAYLAADLGLSATNRLRADLTRHVLLLDLPFHNAHTRRDAPALGAWRRRSRRRPAMNTESRQAKLLRYGRAHADLVAALERFPREMWHYRAGPGEWTIHEHVIHITDSEANSFVRCRRLVAEPGSPVMAYDENVWVRGLAPRASCLQLASGPPTADMIRSSERSAIRNGQIEPRASRVTTGPASQ